MLIDSHCHLYDEKFKDDINVVIDSARKHGVQKMLMPNCDSSTIQAMLALEDRFPERCKAMMGLHPCYVKENYQDELNIVEKWLTKRKFIAIGEIGLDFYWDKTFAKEQEITLRQQIEWALHYNLPIVLHTRDSINETIAIVRDYTAQGLQGVFHCFGGNASQAKIITNKLGFYLGIGGVLTFKNSGLKEAIKDIPLEALLLETDAPYLAPTPYRGKRNEPAYILQIAECIAAERNMPVDVLGNFTSKNCKTLFGI